MEAERAASANSHWIEAKDLQIGDRVATISGDAATVVELTVQLERVRVFNLLVDRYHAYAVGDAGVCVHNGGCGFAPQVAALLRIAKEAKARSRARPLSPEDVATLRRWAKEYGVEFRGPEAHRGRLYGSRPHIHVGNVGHIWCRD